MTEPRKRGRRPGFKESEPRAGSLQARLAALALGAVEWIETDPNGYGHIMRTATLPDSRRTLAMQGRRFSCALHRAIPIAGAVDSPMPLLVRVQRVD